MIVSHPPAIYLFTCAIAHIMLIDYLTMRISPHIVLLLILVWTSHSFLKWFWLHFFGGRGDLHPLFFCGTISIRKALAIVMYFVYCFPVRIAINEFADWNKEDSIAFLILFYDIITIDYISHFFSLLIKMGFFIMYFYTAFIL